MELWSRTLLNVLAKKGEPAKYSESKCPKKKEKRFQMFGGGNSREYQY